MLKIIMERLRALILKMNELGIPIPVMRDPATGKGSVTLTMTFISFNTALLGQAGKLAGLLGGIDLSQANYLFLMCLGAYLGRRMQGNSATKEVKMENQP